MFPEYSNDSEFCQTVNIFLSDFYKKFKISPPEKIDNISYMLPKYAQDVLKKSKDFKVKK